MIFDFGPCCHWLRSHDAAAQDVIPDIGCTSQHSCLPSVLGNSAVREGCYRPPPDIRQPRHRCGAAAQNRSFKASCSMVWHGKVNNADVSAVRCKRPNDRSRSC